MSCFFIFARVFCSQDFSDKVLTVEPTNKMPALICVCFQALAKALKINASVTNIKLECNDIGMTSCMMSYVRHPFGIEKFGWFEGAAV